MSIPWSGFIIFLVPVSSNIFAKYATDGADYQYVENRDQILDGVPIIVEETHFYLIFYFGKIKINLNFNKRIKNILKN
jgi:hypothetical protein